MSVTRIDEIPIQQLDQVRKIVNSSRFNRSYLLQEDLYFLSNITWWDKTPQGKSFWKEKINNHTIIYEGMAIHNIFSHHRDYNNYKNKLPLNRKETKTMTTPNMRTVALLAIQGIVTVKATYGKNKTLYTFICEQSLANQLNKSDEVIVSPIKGEAHPQKVVVQSVDPDLDVDINLDKDYRFVLSKYQTESLDRIEAALTQATDELNRKKREAAKQQAVAALGISDIGSIALIEAKK